MASVESNVKTCHHGTHTHTQHALMPSAQPIATVCLFAVLACWASPEGFSCPSGKGDGPSGAGSVKLVPEGRLFASEPKPELFGNPGNPTPGSPESHLWSQKNWLKSRFHFNFAEYGHGPHSFGVLRVMNDDLVQPRRGFGAHPHRDMEILTVIVDGKLTHKDSTGAEETLGRGSIQFMTAGTGVLHSEHNLQEQPLRFIQCWVLPRKRGLPPNYGSMQVEQIVQQQRRNEWFHAASDVLQPNTTPIKVNQDIASMFPKL